MMLLQVEVLVVKTTYQNIGVTYVEDYLSMVLLFYVQSKKVYFARDIRFSMFPLTLLYSQVGYV